MEVFRIFERLRMKLSKVKGRIFSWACIFSNIMETIYEYRYWLLIRVNVMISGIFYTLSSFYILTEDYRYCIFISCFFDRLFYEKFREIFEILYFMLPIIILCMHKVNFETWFNWDQSRKFPKAIKPFYIFLVCKNNIRERNSKFDTNKRSQKQIFVYSPLIGSYFQFVL